MKSGLTNLRIVLLISVIPVIAITLSILSFDLNDSSFFTLHPNDIKHNLLGTIGSSFSALIFFIFGYSAYLFPIFMILVFLNLYNLKKLEKVKTRHIMGILVLMSIISFISANFNWMDKSDYSIILKGGMLGYSVIGLIYPAVGVIGSLFFIIIVSFIAFCKVFSMPLSPNYWIDKIIKNSKNVHHKIKNEFKIERKIIDGDVPLFEIKNKDTSDNNNNSENNENNVLQLPYIPKNTKSKENIDNNKSENTIINKPDNPKYMMSNPINTKKMSFSNKIINHSDNDDDKIVEAIYRSSSEITNKRDSIINYDDKIYTLEDEEISLIDTPITGDILEFTESIEDEDIDDTSIDDEDIEDTDIEDTDIDNDYIEDNIELENEIIYTPENNNIHNSTDTNNNYNESPNVIKKNLDNKIKVEITEQEIINKVCGFDNEDAGNKGYKILEVSNEVSSFDEQEIKRVSNELEKTLSEFSIKANVTNASVGPVITRYELNPAPGIRLSKIVNLSDNIALDLAAQRIRIIAPIPGKSAVGIEVPNQNRRIVTLGDIIFSSVFQNNDLHLPLALGKDVSGSVKIADLVSMPHLLIAGSTGAGKSVAVNSMICSMLHNKSPMDLKMIMIDPKIVELKIYDNIPHLLTPVITQPKEAIKALKWAVGEMERRYGLLDNYNSRDIRSYNNKIKKLRENSIVTDEPLEYIVIIADELADLMLLCGKEAEEQIARLAAMSRAVGIHLILATQRPSVDVITGIIKANIPARIAFQVSSKMESRIIIDGNGAENLLGKGDLLFSMPGYHQPLRIQGAFVSEDEIYEIVQYIKSFGEPNYIEDIFEDENSEYQDGSLSDEPRWKEAVEIVISDRKASASYLQRKMKIGYNRAARIVELMENEGIVGPGQGSKPRDVLVNSMSEIV